MLLPILLALTASLHPVDSSAGDSLHRKIFETPPIGRSMEQPNALSQLDSLPHIDTLHEASRYNFHMQQTVIVQAHPSFSASYSGLRSLMTASEVKTSVTSTFYFGARIWPGAEVYANPELSGGQGLSSTAGVAGFPNGEIYRVGDPTPIFTLARIFLRQRIALGGAESELTDDQNQVVGKTTSNSLIFTVGKYSLTDIFDDNKFSHDPRTQLMNWSLMAQGAWDYPADVRGYTFAFTAEYKTLEWAFRAALSMEPTSANGPDLEYNIGKAHGEVIEVAHQHGEGATAGAFRVDLYRNIAGMGSYIQALQQTAKDSTPNITATEADGRVKYGFGLNFEQGLTSDLGLFARLSYNDGKTETWAFTEIDRSLSLGILLVGNGWHRPLDNVSVGLVANGLSDDHRAYLAAGGYGFIVGDGRLNYASEMIAEASYRYALADHFSLTGDFQGILHPAYNVDRGPVAIFSLRAHFEY